MVCVKKKMGQVGEDPENEVVSKSLQNATDRVFLLIQYLYPNGSQPETTKRQLQVGWSVQS